MDDIKEKKEALRREKKEKQDEYDKLCEPIAEAMKPLKERKNALDDHYKPMFDAMQKKINGLLKQKKNPDG